MPSEAPTRRVLVVDADEIILGDGVKSLKPFARLRKPLELDQLVRTVTACANNRR